MKTHSRSMYRRNRRTRDESRANLSMESLEKRELFVVGADFVPVQTTDFDGVVQVMRADGGRCTGTLLESGRHVLTAGHCVDLQFDDNGDGNLDRGDGIVDNTTFTVRFGVGGRTIDHTGIPRSNVQLPSSATGNWQTGNDIAIITLSELAPSGPDNLGADRSGIYRTGDESGKSFTLVGYGRGGSGTATATTPAGFGATSGIRRSGTNTVDSTSGTQFVYDLDRQSGEVIAAPGDSGGPSYIGGLIAGVTSLSSIKPQRNSAGALSYPSGSAIGEQGWNIRVSQFASWIDSVVNTNYDLVLDMNRQVVGNDAQDDTIDVRYSGANLELLINGRTVHTDLSSRVRSLTLRGSTDGDMFHVMTTHAVTMDGRGGSNVLWAPDRFNQWVIDGTDRGRIDGLATFSNVSGIKGGSQTDIFSFVPGGRMTYSVNGSTGTDVLDYQRFFTGVDVNLAQNRATGVGYVSNVENIKGGSANDLLVGDGNGNTLHGYGGNDILDGGGGADSLYGGDGLDLLVGGLGSDKLHGESHDDILIGGRLTADYSAIRSEWIRTDNWYDQRVANLRNGTGVNGSARLTSSTVVDDGVTDELYGSQGIDWFWGPTGEVKDRQADVIRRQFEFIS